MNGEALRTDVIKNIRACLISVPGGVASSALNHDYRELLGEPIPFRKLGHGSLEEFLKSIPDLMVSTRGSMCMVEARSNAKSGHISDLVEQQRKSKKRIRPSRPKQRRSSVMPRTNTAYRYEPPPGPRFWPPSRPKTSPSYSQQKSFSPPPRYQTQQRPQPPARFVPPTYPPVQRMPQTQPVSPPAGWATSNSVRVPHPSRPVQPPTHPPPQSEQIQNVVPNGVSHLVPPLLSSNGLAEPKSESKIAKTSAQMRLLTISNQQKKVPDEVCRETVINKDGVLESKSEETSSPKIDYLSKLLEFLALNGWAKPQFNFTECKRAKIIKMCNLTLCRRDGQNFAKELVFSSYPYEFKSEERQAALYLVAERAYNALVKPSVILPITKSRELIVQRICQMIEGRTVGVWLFQIENDYQIKFNESLPPNYIDYLSECLTLDFHKVGEEIRIVVPLSTPRQMASKGTAKTIQKLTYPADNDWDVFVTKFVSPSQVFVRLIGDEYSGEYDNLTTDMELHYFDSNKPVTMDLKIGNYYVWLTEDSCVRVMVTSIENDSAHVYLIDIGDSDVAPLSALRILEDKFYNIPAQAILCYLTGLEIYSFTTENHELKNSLIELVMGKSFVGTVTGRDPVSIILHDTSGPADLNVNEVIQVEIVSSFAQPSFQENGVNEMVMSYVSDSGYVYLQMPSFSLSCLEEKLNEIHRGDYHAKPLSESPPFMGSCFLRKENEVCRVVMTKRTSSEDVLVTLIDQGCEESVCASDLFIIPPLTELMNRIPPQAIKATLNDFGDFTLQKKEHLLELAPIGSKVFIKVVSISSGIPNIEIFVRTPPKNLLVSVNQTVALNCPKKTSQTKNGPILSATSQEEMFELPGIGEDLDVFVTDTANPDNFTIQPVICLEQLNHLATTMSRFYQYSRNDGFVPTEGDLVATFRVYDNVDYWMRARVIKKCGLREYSVKLCDYGNMEVAYETNMRKLDPSFQKYPFMAFSARLHNILPKHKDWTVEDCIRFRDLIHYKKCVSVIKEIVRDPITNDLKLSLDVIDTSTVEDRCIGKMLVHEGRAVHKI